MMLKRKLGAFIFGLACIVVPIQSVMAQTGIYTPVQTTPQDLSTITEGKVVEILKPDLIRLDNDLLYIIDNTRVPVLYSEAALGWLDRNLLNQTVILRANPDLGPGEKDRMGNRFAHIVLKDSNVWVQQAMIADGIAWADSTKTNRDLIAPLLQTEEAARAGQKGFWAAAGMAPRKSDAIGHERDSFMIVEGRVLNTADKKKIFFINFGDDWKTDFTLSLRVENVVNFPRGFTVAGLEGKTLRVRGWISERNGPMMELTHIEQIEILDTPALAKP